MIIASPKDVYQKKVLIMGLGMHGGGVAAAYWFFRQGAETIVTDLKSRKELESSIAKLTALCNEYRLSHPGKRLYSIEYVLGKHRGEDIVRSDVIIQNPGVPRESLFLEIAREHGKPIHNDASIFFTLVRKAPTIGITGTRGKTTTASMIMEVLKTAYPRVVLTGIATPQGSISLFSQIDRVLEHEEKGEIAPVIIELSSWQLEVLGTWGYSPQCAVITNIYPDHLNRYRSMDEYIDAKKNILRFAALPSNTAVLNADDPIVRTFVSDVSSSRTCYWFSRKGRDEGLGCHIAKGLISCRTHGDQTSSYESKTIGMRAPHLLQNALAALTVGMLYGVNAKKGCEALAVFRGVAGRLEYLGTIEGRGIYNDTTATSPDATCAALVTLGGRSKRIILIAGGADKRLVFDELGRVIARFVKTLVLLSGTASPHIVSAATAAGYSGSLDIANSMGEAVSKAWKRSQRRDIILLSPAAASFGLFQHEFDRGRQFIECVDHLRTTT